MLSRSVGLWVPCLRSVLPSEHLSHTFVPSHLPWCLSRPPDRARASGRPSGVFAIQPHPPRPASFIRALGNVCCRSARAGGLGKGKHRGQGDAVPATLGSPPLGEIRLNGRVLLRAPVQTHIPAPLPVWSEAARALNIAWSSDPQGCCRLSKADLYLQASLQEGRGIPEVQVEMGGAGRGGVLPVSRLGFELTLGPRDRPCGPSRLGMQS